MEDRLVDLDELVLRCRNDQARSYIAEAVACYRAGAFRACIVTSWVAVVYDILHKLDELALAGDKNAESKRQEFEGFRQRTDVANSLRFERQILDIAKDEFELISPIEHEDLQRLIADRNRCAHPSMNAYDEVYQPTAELARYHLRNAVTHLLQHQPVQGKAALDRLVREINSLYFPQSPTDAITYFRHGPLHRPREVLVRNFCILLIKAMICSDLDESAFARHASALNAVRAIHRATTEKTLEQHLSDTIRSIEDAQFGRAIHFLASVADTWQFLAPDIRTRVERFIDILDIPRMVTSFAWVTEFAPLKTKILLRLQHLTESEMHSIIKIKPSIELVPRALELYSEAQSFNHANKLAEKIIIPLIQFFTMEDVQSILGIVSTNAEVSGSFEFSDVIRRIISKKVFPVDVIESVIVKSCIESSAALSGLKDMLTIKHLECFADEKMTEWTFQDLLKEFKKSGKISDEQYRNLIARRGITEEEEEDLPF